MTSEQEQGADPGFQMHTNENMIAGADPHCASLFVSSTANLSKDDEKDKKCPMTKSTEQIDVFMQAAIDEAKKGLSSGGIPIGSVLVLDDEIVGRGHNQRVQKGSPVLHAEMDCIEDGGRLTAADYRRSVIYSTLSPCDMCSGAILLYKIPFVIVGENRTFQGPEDYLRSRGVDVRVVDSAECIRMMEEFIRDQPALWNEDVGEEVSEREG